jgi:hypothetical protein
MFGEFYNYFYMHVWNRIGCLDRDKSELELYDDGDIFSIDQLVLDETRLDSIDHQKRKLFYLEENTSILLAHETIVEQIISSSLTGVRFFKATEWNSDIAFE